MKISDKEQRWLREYDGLGKRMEPFFKIVKERSAKVENAKELEEDVRGYYMGLFDNYINDCYEISGIQFQLRLSSYYKEHENEIEPLYNLVCNEDTEIKDVFVGDFEEASKTFMREMIEGTGEELELLKASIKYNLRTARADITQTLKAMEKAENFRIRTIAEYVQKRLEEEKYKKEDERQDLYAILEEPIEFSVKEVTRNIKELPSNCQNYLRAKYSKALLEGKELLKEIGAFPIYISQYNRDLKRIGIGEEPMLIDEDKEGSIDEILSEDKLKNCSLEELNLLNIFWQNRIAKEVSSVSNMLYLASHNHIYQKAMKGEKLEEPSIANYSRAMQQKRMLDNMISYAYDHTTDFEKKCHDEVYKKEIAKKQEQYRNADLKEKRNLLKDMDSYEDWFYIQRDCYGQKDNLIYQLITELNENHNLRNWGINLEGKQGENIAIEVDYPGYNLPCMFHVNEELVRRALTGMRQKTLLPIYEGDSDRNISIDPDKKQMIACNLLLPITKEQKKYLKAKSKELKKTFLDPTEENPYSLNYQKYKLVDHMIAIAEGGYPEHLKNRRFEKNRIFYTRGPRRYIDIETGEFYRKAENGKIEPAEEGR